ncbi:helix-turn-helix transcriptional regulator [Saccharothrix coeruleofusca]|nr:helix-turn-helix transcriptional regulator [Saccharothrix coeruleofusca]
MTFALHGDGAELGHFLRTRRARLTPADVGLPASAGLRRRPGLRREDLASLAGVSTDYYTRLEQGRRTRPSPSVVAALARALRLDEADHERLRELAVGVRRAATGQEPDREVNPATALLVESLRPNPAQLLDHAMNLLTWNPGGLDMYAGIEEWPAERRNVARYVFLHPAATDLFPAWEHEARCCVAYLRTSFDRRPDDPALTSLVAELTLGNPEFGRLWKRSDVRGRPSGVKTLRHPRAGAVTLRFQVSRLVGAPGRQHSVTYYADPGTADYDRMVLLDATASDQAQPPAERAG